jgi:DNA-binding transcriptional MerR regulator
MDTGLRIGEVAKRAGVSIDTLRYYERLKLLPRSRRSSGGFRLFAPEHIERVQFIKQAQELGFSLTEIRELFALAVISPGPLMLIDLSWRLMVVGQLDVRQAYGLSINRSSTLSGHVVAT